MKKTIISSSVFTTKESIINTARQLFSEHSYLSVSMSDIAEKLNITKLALYYYFTSKMEIYKRVLDEVFRDLRLIIVSAFNEKTNNRRTDKGNCKIKKSLARTGGNTI